MTILKYPHPMLRQVSGVVTDFGPTLVELTQRMFHIMRESNGVGLAAPQIGILKRLFVCNYSGEPKDDLVVVNPQLAQLEGIEPGEEGCLSIPEVNVTVRRAQSCVLTAQDPEGNPFEQRGGGLEARVWQHENDHLNGRLILDYMDEASKLANRKAIKHLESTFKA